MGNWLDTDGLLLLVCVVITIMKQLLKFISDDGRWIIEETPESGIRLYKCSNYLHPRDGIAFVRDDIGTLIGLLTKVEQQLNENPSETKAP